MIAKEQLREDLYKAIIGHYEKCDFTEALRDAMFFIRDVLQEKSGYVDKDNTSLVEASLLGKNPAIRINKFETQAEKDFQEGISVRRGWIKRQYRRNRQFAVSYPSF